MKLNILLNSINVSLGNCFLNDIEPEYPLNELVDLLLFILTDFCEINSHYNEFIELIITDESEDLVVEIWNKNGNKDKLICGSKLNLKKYLDGEIYFEWIKMDKIALNIALQVKREGEKYMTIDDINKYVNANVLDDSDFIK